MTCKVSPLLYSFGILNKKDTTKSVSLCVVDRLPNPVDLILFIYCLCGLWLCSFVSRIVQIGDTTLLGTSLVPRPPLAAFFVAVEKNAHGCEKSCERRPGYEANWELLWE